MTIRELTQELAEVIDERRNMLIGEYQYKRINRILVFDLVIDFMREVWTRSICRRYGHQWSSNDESWFGPDSGGAGGTCIRCGYSWSHTYY